MINNIKILSFILRDVNYNTRWYFYKKLIIRCFKLVYPKILTQKITKIINFYCKKYNFHIVSNSDQKELRFLYEKLYLGLYFISINGIPIPKNYLVSNLIEKYTYDKKNTCLVKDFIYTFQIANKNQIEFYGCDNIFLKEKYSYIKVFDNFIY